MNSSQGRNPTGWRKQTIARLQYAQMAKAAAFGRHSRAEIRHLLNRIRPALGLGTTQTFLLNILFDATYEQDWQVGRAPIVWPSNETLARQLSISVNATRDALRFLADEGLIAYQNSANCRRAGQRDRNGRIIYAYGINLALLEARYDELKAQADHHDDETARRRVLRNDITSLRRTIEATIEMARDRVPAERLKTFERQLGLIGPAWDGSAGPA
ncbi:hypothetical protein FJU08_20915 [Martelella alba]|uniref:Plasmid replication protein C N-terminal domain-containing protein n=1 Tax=Martelella alba TaxID=2590451 RepID=A0A506TYA6_9HYPH|nr:helix-turn-helix domain-containing protein [Martelella alba]TPW27073.1 hypothetical protein FJU08_20915 [Martelella alba]